MPVLGGSIQLVWFILNNQESDGLTITPLKMESCPWRRSAATLPTLMRISLVGSNPEELNVTQGDLSSQCAPWKATCAAVRETSGVQKQAKDVKKRNCS